jgi:hypothetical protein
VAKACDRVFPERKGYFTEYYEESKSWVPVFFRDWPEIEDKAKTLRVWMTGVVHGLLQTEGYARALLSTSAGATEETIERRLRSRMDRQRRVLLREPDPPLTFFVVDEIALYREVGSTEVMAERATRGRTHLSELADWRADRCRSAA